MAIITIFGDIVQPPRYKDSGSSRHQAVKKNDIKSPCLYTQEITPGTGRGSKRPAIVEVTAFSKSYSMAGVKNEG